MSVGHLLCRRRNLFSRAGAYCPGVHGKGDGSIGLFRFDLVAWICGGQTAVAARVIYTLVGLAAVWCISLLFRGRDELDGAEDM